MISVSQALSFVRSEPLPPVFARLTPGLVLAADVFAPLSLPPFPQSSVDGYALAHGSVEWLEVVGEIPAGSVPNFRVGPGQAARIFTGAMLPPGADSVIMQEQVMVSGTRIRPIYGERGSYVRLVGSEIGAGAPALAAGTVLSPGAVGFLASMGIDQVSVYPPPRIGLITTGSELQVPGRALGPGQVYESNSYALRAALGGLAFHRSAPDDPGALLEEALDRCDVLLVTGGVSVGDYDFVAGALEAAGVECLFHRVKQRPGKPLWFGAKGRVHVFGLPGNPASVLTCYYIYIRPLLDQLAGRAPRVVGRLPLGASYKKQAGLTHFLKGVAMDGCVTPLHGQESYRMSAFVRANCLIVLPEEAEVMEKGDLVDVYYL
jgi:molybdopterin molybdotransferase